MGLVFGRNGGPHPFDQALEELHRDPDPGVRAVSCNLQHDHRVSREREAVFHFVLQQVRQMTDPRRPAGALHILVQNLLQAGLLGAGTRGGPIDGSALREAVRVYQERYVRTRRRPDFLFSFLSRHNRVSGRWRLRRDDWLVHVKDLNRLKVYEFADQRSGEWPLLERGKTAASTNHHGTDLDAWLNDNLDPRRRLPTDRNNFLRQILEAEAAIRASNSKYAVYEPCWASRFDDFEKYVDLKSDPPLERWLEAFGMPVRLGHWYLLLKYQVKDAGTLFRPTQLDAGWNEYHFPSPPCAPLDRGGHPMDLGTPPAVPTLLPEYIHRQVNFQWEHVLRLKQAKYRSGAVYPDLDRCRPRHHSRLDEAYPGGRVRIWMRRP